MSSFPYTGGLASENMTVLDCFALEVMKILLVDKDVPVSDVIKHSYGIAGEMIKERERKC